MTARLSPYAHSLAKMHFIVFIWGFTGILGGLISVDAVPLVWHRLLFALIILIVYAKYTQANLSVNKKDRPLLVLGGLAIAAHWVTFYYAIKISTISITLACLSAGAFFAALLEPLVFKRKISGSEVLFGVGMIASVSLLFSAEWGHSTGIAVALFSALLSALFSVINGTLVHRNPAMGITVFELFIAFVSLTMVSSFTHGLWETLTSPQHWDWLWIGLLATACTAYAFIQSVKVMKFLSPFTVMLSINLEPVYGILLALAVFGEAEVMSTGFYIGASLMLGLVVLHSLIKRPTARTVE